VAVDGEGHVVVGQKVGGQEAVDAARLDEQVHAGDGCLVIDHSLLRRGVQWALKMGIDELGAVQVGRRDQGVGTLKILQEHGDVAEWHDGSGEQESLEELEAMEQRNLWLLGWQGCEERLMPNSVRLWLVVGGSRCSNICRNLHQGDLGLVAATTKCVFLFSFCLFVCCRKGEHQQTGRASDLVS
jgi:hypothetical protein